MRQENNTCLFRKLERIIITAIKYRKGKNHEHYKMGILYGFNHNHCFIADGMWHQGGKNFKSSCKKRQVQKVYIEEQEGYTPYLVLSGNYDGKVLLLREQVLPELMQYKEHSPLWGQGEYGSYYEQSSVDAYLNRNL